MKNTVSKLSASANILIIDDHSLFRAGMKILLMQHPNIEQVVEASSVQDALAMDENVAKIIFLDIHMPDANGLLAIDAVKSYFSQSKTVMLSASDNPRDVKQAKQLGADGFLHKSMSAEEIFSAIDGLLGNKPCFPELDEAHQMADSSARLTQRQIEVLALLCEGLSNKLIARRLDLSENTVRVHVSAILSVMNVSTRTEAILLAQNGRGSTALH